LKSDISKIDNQMKKVAYLRLIETKEDWQSAKNEGGGLSAIFDAIPVAATVDFSAFQQWQKTVYSQTSFRFSDNEAHSLQASFLPDYAVTAWLKCMGSDSGGLTLAIDDVSQDTAAVHLYWIAPKGAVGLKQESVKITQSNEPTGGSLQERWPLRDPVDTSLDKKIIYRRKAHEDLIVSIEVKDAKGQSTVASIRVPADPVYIKSCNLPMADVFKGVFADGNGWSISCSGFEPGRKVSVKLDNTKFKVDQSGTIWIVVRASIAGGQENFRQPHC
jgi:hypothetical protein